MAFYATTVINGATNVSNTIIDISRLREASVRQQSDSDSISFRIISVTVGAVFERLDHA